MFSRLITILFFVAAPLLATGGADELFKALPKSMKSAEKVAQSPQAMLEGGLNLSDPFLVQFYSKWSQQQNLPYEVNLWALNFLKGKHEEAAHLWSTISRKIPSSFHRAASTAQLYLLWKLGVPQTFMDQWLESMASPNFRKSSEARSFEQTVLSSIDSYLLDNAIQLSETHRATVLRLNPNNSYVVANLQAYALMREGSRGAKLLSKLPHNNRLKIPLIQTVVLSMAKQGRIDRAARILKQHMEPAIETTDKPESLAGYYLQIARLLYQVGALDGAEQFYLKVPNKTPEYLSAREELLWVWLRQGKRKEVRGTLASFDTGLFEDTFSPDVYVVRAISNLKLCYYDRAQKDINEFSKTYSRWAEKIEHGVKTADPKGLHAEGFFVDLAKRAVGKREAETKALRLLYEASVEAALPAVGRQVYWERAQKRLQASLEAGKQTLSSEYRLHWNNRKKILGEAIRKMNFVKVELLSQVQRYADEATTAVSKQRRLALKTSPTEQNFPFDGVVWPDELFKVQSLAQAKCLGSADE